MRIVRWCVSTVSSQLKWKQIYTIRMWSIPDFTDKYAMCGISRKRTLQRPPFEVKSVSRCQSVRLRIPLGWASLLDIQDTNSFRGRNLRDVTIFVIPYRCQVWHFQLLTHVLNLFTLRTYWHLVSFASIYWVFSFGWYFSVVYNLNL